MIDCFSGANHQGNKNKECKRASFTESFSLYYIRNPSEKRERGNQTFQENLFN